MKPNPTELAYTAGLIDGEGTITLGKKVNVNLRNPSYALVLSITNTNLVMLQWVKDRFGGIIQQQGKVKAGHKQCYKLTFRLAEIKDYLPQLIPFLVIKKAQAELLLKFLNLTWTTSPRFGKPLDIVIAEEAIYEEIVALNRRGTDALTIV